MTIDLDAASAALRERLGAEPFEAALVLGSGLGGLADAVDDPVAVPFTALPGFPGAAVAGHAGRWVGGWLEGRRILVQDWRYHIYEGWPPELVCAAVYLAAALGAGVLVVTNAAGSVRRAFEPGTLVALTDHLNLMGRRFALLRNLPGEGRMAALTEPYDRELRRSAAVCARELGVALEQGVYAALSGPSYETPAEIRMVERLGADLVGMSTVPEVISARTLGVRSLGLSLVTNWAAGIAPTPLDHEEVVAMGRRTAGTLERLLRRIVRELPRA